MAQNPKKAIVHKIDGKEYKLSFSMNSLCELEEATNQGALGFVSEMSEWEGNPEKVRFGKMRTLFWAALVDNHDIDLKMAGQLMSHCVMEELMPKVFEAFNTAFPDGGAEGETEGN